MPPAIPGKPIDSDIEHTLRQHVAFLCNTLPHKFPGSQPVSFGSHHLQALQREDYWVCEKSDGIRLLLFIVINPRGNVQEVYLIDRHNKYYEQDGLVFPHFTDPIRSLRDTLLDCELVEDTDPRTGMKTLRLLIFDCLIADSENIMDRPLTKRYGRIRDRVYKPFSAMLTKFPEFRKQLPFQIAVKEMKPSYHVASVLSSLPTLQHTSDGLIFTPVTTFYVPGTDSNLLKWKPKADNSIDLLLLLHFPSSTRPSEPDLAALPRAALYTWLGGSQYAFFDLLALSPSTWEKWKASGESYHGRVVEVAWEEKTEEWRVLRFRDDKPNANHVSVVEKVLESIRDGVEPEELVRAAPAIRAAWKEREDAQKRQEQQQPQQQEKLIKLMWGIMPRAGRSGGRDLLGRLYGPVVVEGWVR